MTFQEPFCAGTPQCLFSSALLRGGQTFNEEPKDKYFKLYGLHLATPASYGAKSDTDNSYMFGGSRVTMKLYFQKTGGFGLDLVLGPYFANSCSMRKRIQREHDKLILL